MTFVESTTPDITEGIPTPLSRAQAASQVFSQSGAHFNIAIAGIPFLLAANDQNPYQRKSAPIQKQQIDTARDAGEQTLDGYWIRSQTNWDHGAGIRFYEPTLDPPSVDRFEDSLGVDVWTKGKFSLLKRMMIGGSEDFTYAGTGPTLRTNVATNPGCTSTTNGIYSNSGGLYTLTSVGGKIRSTRSATSQPGTNVTSCYITGATSSTISQAVTPGTNVTLSLDVTTSQPSRTISLSLQFRDASNTIVVSSVGGMSTTATTAGTYRLSANFTAPALSAAVLGNVNVTSGSIDSTGETVDFDNLLIELGPMTVGSYFDGGTTDTSSYAYSWTGTADASTSIQQASIEVPNNPASVSTGQIAYVTGAVVGGNDVIFTNENGVVKRRNANGTVAASYTGSFDTPATRVAVGGAKIYVGMAFGLSYGDANGSTLSTRYTMTLGSSPVPYWVKSRIIATQNQKIFELAPDGSTGGGSIDSATPIYVHPDTGWTWSGIAEGPAAIYAAGYGNGRSAIYAFTLQDASSGTVPSLSQAYQVAELPSGEEVRSIHATLGTYLGVGTTKGMRVAAIQGDGTLAMGPLLFNSTKPVTAITSGDRFLYGALETGHPDGMTGAVRVDLSRQIMSTEGSVYGTYTTLRFPYAWDARPGITGIPSSIAMFGNSEKVCIGITGAGIYTQRGDRYEASGYLTSGRIRYGTVIPKSFHLLGVNESTGLGSFAMYLVQANDDDLYLRTSTNGTSADNVSLSAAQVTENYRFKIKLMPTTDLLTSPVVESMQVRALPAPQRQRLIQYPLFCMNYEQTAEGVKLGTDDYAITRLKALEYAEENYVTITVQDFDTDETFEAVIEEIGFRRPGPRSTDGRRNFGGYVDLTVRKL